MIVIKCSVYEQGDLVRYLEELKKYKLKNRPRQSGNKKFDSTDYDIDRINILINRIKGNDYKQEYVLQTNRYKEDISSERNFYNSEEAKENYQRKKREKIEII